MKQAAHEKRYLTSDVMLLFSLAVGFAFEHFFPTSFPLLRATSITISILVFAIAWTFIILSKCELKKFSQPSKPLLPTTGLVTSGVFAYTRNPIYLGVFFICVAIGFLCNSVWVIAASLLSFMLMTYFLILPEEKYLAENFGDEYHTYKKRVRRWF